MARGVIPEQNRAPVGMRHSRAAPFDAGGRSGKHKCGPQTARQQPFYPPPPPSQKRQMQQQAHMHCCWISEVTKVVTAGGPPAGCRVPPSALHGVWRPRLAAGSGLTRQPWLGCRHGFGVCRMRSLGPHGRWRARMGACACPCDSASAQCLWRALGQSKWRAAAAHPASCGAQSAPRPPLRPFT